MSSVAIASIPKNAWRLLRIKRQGIGNSRNRRGEIQSLNERIEAMSQAAPITNPVAMLVRAGWKFSAYQSPDTWQVWAKHPLGGACMVAELTRIGRTGFDVKATAEAVAEFLNRI